MVVEYLILPQLEKVLKYKKKDYIYIKKDKLERGFLQKRYWMACDKIA